MSQVLPHAAVATMETYVIAFILRRGNVRNLIAGEDMKERRINVAILDLSVLSPQPV